MTAPLVMMSCRALGRGALDALLAWMCQAAAQAGATELAVPCLVTDRNVPMRLALAAAGLRAEPGAVAPDGRAIFTRSLTGDLPALPDWATVEANRDRRLTRSPGPGRLTELRQLLAEVTGRPDLVDVPAERRCSAAASAWTHWRARCCCARSSAGTASTSPPRTSTWIPWRRWAP